MNFLKTELHCHNEFSNFHQAEFDTPYDCNIGIQEQLDQSHKLGLNCLFVTNHNTLDGYNQLLEFQKNHQKYQNIRIFPAEEITTDEGAHVIAYGIHKEIKPGLSFEETVDEIRKQDAISSAPHPFGVLDALREKAKSCDLIEVFNSNNVDVLANAKATLFADENNITGVAGSDSHVLSTLGRCTNVIESENTLDDILHSMKHRKISIQTTGYVTAQETLEYFRYKVDNSTEWIQDYVAQFYPKSKRLFSLLLKLFEYYPNSYLWILSFKIGLYAMKRISRKINFENLDPTLMKDRNLSTILKIAI